MTKFLVVGSGAQGAPCAAILNSVPSCERVLLGSRKVADPQAVVDRLGSRKASAAAFDASNPDSIVSAVGKTIGSVDAVIDLAPSFCSLNVMKAALALGAHYVNTAACPEHLAQMIERKPLDLDREFKDAELIALLSFGASPGALNVLCRKFAAEFDALDRVEIRAGFHSPSQHEKIKTWTPSWSPEQQYFDYCDPPCLFHDGRHQHMPQFYEPETYDFGGTLGKIELTHHAHDEQYSLPINLGKGIRYCCYKYPFEPAVATFFATGFTQDRVVEVNDVRVRAVDVLMQLLPRPVQVAVLDREAQRGLVPIIADTRAHILMSGTAGGMPKSLRIETAVYYDEAAKALELFGSAAVGVPYAAVVGALQVLEGGVKPGVRWPEELAPDRFLEISDSLGLRLGVDLKRDG